MKVTDFLFNEFVYGGHWGSLSSSAIVLSVMLMLNLSIRFEFLLIVYLGCQCIYSYNHYKEIEIDSLSNSRRAQFLSRYYKILKTVTFTYGFFFIFLLIFFQSWKVLLFGTMMLVIGLLFTYQAKSLSEKIVGFKSIYASFAWSLLVPFTVLYINATFNIGVFLISIFVFLRFMIDTSFFDIKDIKSDNKRKLKTYVIYFGEKRCLSFLHFLNLISFLPILLGVLFHFLPKYSLALFFVLLYDLYYIERSRNRKVDIQSLSYIVVDGEYYYWPLLIFAGMILFT
jgi:4-hydroxybenzoate polyprenyltransferase